MATKTKEKQPEQASMLVVRENDIPDVPAQRQEADPFINMIESLAANPEVDVEKLQKIMDMQEHILDRNAEQLFNAAMVKAQQNIPIVPTDKPNAQTKSMYSSYESILKHCQPVYTKEGFSIMFYEGETPLDNHIRIMADVMHEGGCTKVRHVDIPLDSAGIAGKVNKTPTHAKGSSVSYGRSYLMKMIFNIPTGNDDDGNGSQPVKVITEAQAADITALAGEVKANMVPILKFKHVTKLEDLPASSYNEVIKILEAKRNDNS